MPERCDQCHVSLPEPTAGLDVDGHLSLVTASALINPGQVHHGVHRLIRQFGGKFDVGAIEGRELPEAEIRCCIAQIVRQSVGESGLVRTRNRQCGGGIIPTKPTAEAPADTEQHASREGIRAGPIEGSHYLEQRLEVVGATVHWKGPDILHSEVWRDFADKPGARFVSCFRKPS